MPPSSWRWTWRCVWRWRWLFHARASNKTTCGPPNATAKLAVDLAVCLAVAVDFSRKGIKYNDLRTAKCHRQVGGGLGGVFGGGGGFFTQGHQIKRLADRQMPPPSWRWTWRCVWRWRWIFHAMASNITTCGPPNATAKLAVDLAVCLAVAVDFSRNVIKYNDLRTAKCHRQVGGGLGGVF